MKNLKHQLIEQALAGGICGEGHRNMQSMDMDSLVDYYLANPDWCLERSFPSMDVLEGSFSDMGQRGVFVNRAFDGELLDGRQVYVFHHCSGYIRTGLNIGKGIIPMMYFANGCDMCLSGNGIQAHHAPASVVPLSIYGDNTIVVVNDESTEFKTTNYSVQND